MNFKNRSFLKLLDFTPAEILELIDFAAELKAQLAPLGVPMYAAALHTDSRSVVGTDLKKACVVIGNEAHGVSDATLEACDGSLIIPIHTAESLNAAVAATIVMWQMKL